MQSIALIVHVILAVGVIGLVLMQHGKGADAGAAFGSGASATVFGASGSASFLTKATTLLAALFFATSIFLFYLAAHRDSSVRSVTDGISVIQEEAASEEQASDLPGVLDSEGTPAEESSDLPGALESAVEGAGNEDMPVPAQ